jgi:hypothetical protein
LQLSPSTCTGSSRWKQCLHTADDHCTDSRPVHSTVHFTVPGMLSWQLY